KTNKKFTLIDIPAAYQAEADKFHHDLLDVASHCCDEMVELIVEGKPVPKELLKKALRKGTIDGTLTPIFCGSSKNFHGVELLLDSVIDYLPSPLERPAVEGIVPKSKEKVQRKADP